MSAPVLLALLSFALTHSAHGHGAVTKPYPRELATQTYCPWCIGEHQPLSNPFGKAHHDAKPSSPCMGTSRGEEPYIAQQYARYASQSGPGPTEYVRGQPFDSRIVLDADHNGDAQWSVCSHSDGETEDCFREHPLTEWTDVHSYWDPTNTEDHWKSGETYPQTVTLPSSIPVGPATLRWLWVCKWTDEIFVSCIDIDVKDSAGVSPTKAPVASPSTSTSPTTPTPSPTITARSDVECLWTDPPGRTIQRTPREQKSGRTCWDFVVEPGTTVHYQSNTDIYITWNVQACCLRASQPYASATGAPASIVSFTPTGSTFGFCECSAWDPNNHGVSCAGGATAASMVCTVDGDDSAAQRSHGMCADSTTLDNLPVKCDGPVTEPEPESEPEPTSEPETAPESEPDAEPEAESEPEPTAEPETTPEPEPEAEPQPEPTSVPEAEPTPTPQSGNTPVPTGSVPSNQPCGGEHQKCGGANWAGATCCQAGLLCEAMNLHHSRCVRLINDGPCTDSWKQCGGVGWTGATCCADGLTCKRYNDHYSQCVPQGSLAQVGRHGSTLLRGHRDTVGGVLMQQAVKLEQEGHEGNDEASSGGDVMQDETAHTHEEL